MIRRAIKRKASAIKDYVFNYQKTKNENPIFKFPVESLEILQDPVDFYSALYVGPG